MRWWCCCCSAVAIFVVASRIFSLGSSVHMHRLEGGHFSTFLAWVIGRHTLIPNRTYPRYVESSVNIYYKTKLEIYTLLLVVVHTFNLRSGVKLVIMVSLIDFLVSCVELPTIELVFSLLKLPTIRSKTPSPSNSLWPNFYKEAC